MDSSSDLVSVESEMRAVTAEESNLESGDALRHMRMHNMGSSSSLGSMPTNGSSANLLPLSREPTESTIRPQGFAREADSGFSWVIVAASFMVHVVSMGLPASFGVFIDTYLVEFPGATSLSIAFIGSLAGAGEPIFAILAGRMSDLYGPRIVCMLGAVVLCASLMLASYSTAVWHLLLSHGVLFGMSTSLAFLPAITVLPGWFVKRRGLALGIASSGAGIGGLTFSPLLRSLISRLGWRVTLRVIGGAGGAILLLAALPLHVRVPSTHSKTSPNVRGFFKDSLFVRLFALILVYSFAYFVPLFFVPTYASQYGISEEDGALLVGILNGASGLGRIAMGYAADYTGFINGFVLSLFLSTASLSVLWPIATSFRMLLAFVLVFGVFVGGTISLLPSVIAQLFGAEGNIATVSGTIFSAFMFGDLFGTPIAGAIIDMFTTYSSTGAKTINFLPMIIFSAGCIGISALIGLSIKISASRRRFFAKA